MKRFVCGVWLVLVGLAAGCQRIEPLHVRVKAETPAEFFDWQERVLERQPESVVFEFKESVARIVICSPTKMSLAEPAMMHSKFHPICRELNGKPVRDVIIAGYAAVNEELLRCMILDSETLVVLLNLPQGVEGDAADRKTVKRLVDRRSSLLDEARAQVEANRLRIAELKRSEPVPRPDFFMWFAGWRAAGLLVP